MDLTAKSVHTLLTQRVRRLLSALSYDADKLDTMEATNYALRELGYTVTDLTKVTSADVAEISTADINKFLDTAELRQLETLLNDFAVEVTTAIGPRREELSNIAAVLENIIARKAADLASRYGTGVASLSGGVIDLNFAETNSTS